MLHSFVHIGLKSDRFREITGYFCFQVTEEEKTGAEEAAANEKEVRGVPCDMWAGSELISVCLGAFCCILLSQLVSKVTVSEK